MHNFDVIPSSYHWYWRTEFGQKDLNICRSFNPQNNVNARTKFKYQLEIIKNAMCENCLVIRNFHLDYSRIYEDNYCYKNLFADFDDDVLS